MEYTMATIFQIAGICTKSLVKEHAILHLKYLYRHCVSLSMDSVILLLIYTQFTL